MCAGLLATAGTSAAQEETAAETPVVTAPKRFLPAAGELVLLEIAPWAFDRYATNEDFAHISFRTVKANFKAGFGYDSDTFNVNQSSHPYHGSLFFAAARSNGYNFWESGAFTLAGSLLWECCMENTRPSLNDLVNTTLGGMTRGEISHRVATIIRGGGVRVAGRLLAQGREILTAGYGVVWTRTVNGLSRNNTLQCTRAALRVPVFGAVGVGAAYAWYSRKTSYPGFFEARRAQSEWRFFLDWVIAKRFGQTP